MTRIIFLLDSVQPEHRNGGRGSWEPMASAYF